MKKALLNLTLLIFAIGSLYYALSQVDWLTKFKIKSLPTINENKIGDFIWKQAQYDLNLFSEKSKSQVTLEKLFRTIKKANSINDTIYRVHLNQTSEVNAYAFPGGHLVVNTALISKCETEGELMSVMSHEIAHLNENHPIQLLKREVGVAILSSIILGEKSRHVIAQITNTLASAAYQREEESLADSLGLVYLVKCKKSPKEFINFQKNMEREENEMTKSLEFISSHPNWEARIESLQLQAAKMDYKEESSATILTDEEWQNLKQASTE